MKRECWSNPAWRVRLIQGGITSPLFDYIDLENNRTSCHNQHQSEEKRGVKRFIFFHVFCPEKSKSGHSILIFCIDKFVEVYMLQLILIPCFLLILSSKQNLKHCGLFLKRKVVKLKFFVEMIPDNPSLPVDTVEET